MATTPDIGKLKRSYLMHYIDASFGGENPKWFLIGRDIEDKSVTVWVQILLKVNFANP